MIRGQTSNRVFWHIPGFGIGVRSSEAVGLDFRRLWHKANDWMCGMIDLDIPKHYQHEPFRNATRYHASIQTTPITLIAPMF